MGRDVTAKSPCSCNMCSIYTLAGHFERRVWQHSCANELAGAIPVAIAGG